MLCQQHARARPGARARQRTLTHIDTHTDAHTDPGGGNGSARQREPPRKRETRRRVQLRGGRCHPAGAPRRPQPARERLERLLMRRPRPPTVAASDPPGRAPNSRPRPPGLARRCVVGGLLPQRRGATSRDAAQASPAAVSFFALTLTAPPHPAPSPPPPRRAALPVRAAARSSRGGKVSPQPLRSACRGGCDMCQILAPHRGRGLDPTSPLVVPFHLALGWGKGQWRGR